MGGPFLLQEMFPKSAGNEAVLVEVIRCCSSRILFCVHTLSRPDALIQMMWSSDRYVTALALLQGVQW